MVKNLTKKIQMNPDGITTNSSWSNQILLL